MSADEYMSFLGLDELAKEIREAADLLDGLPEGQQLTGDQLSTVEDVRQAALRLADRAEAVLEEFDK